MKDTTNQGRTEDSSPLAEPAASEPDSPYEAPEDRTDGGDPSPESDPASASPDPVEQTFPPEPEALYSEPTGPSEPEPGETFVADSPYAVETEESGLAAPEPTTPAPPPPPASPPPAEEDEDPEEDELGARMTFLEHLDELRKRLLHSIIALAVGFAGCWIFREQIFLFIRYPIDQVLDQLIITKPTDAFTIYMKVSFVGAIFVAIPVILLQLWMFIAPGLYRKEKRYILPFLLSSTVLFVLGGAFAYYIVLPPALQFLLIEFGQAFVPLVTAQDYFDFVFLIIVGMGAVFQLPVLIAFLSLFGLVSPRFLWRNFRYAFLLIVIVAAIVSPTTDPFNLLLWTGPMVVLYLISIAVSWVFKRRRARRDAEEL
jgi:sec-independent protein translocase protein TatC